MTIHEIQTRKDYQTFDCKSIQIDPKALAVPKVDVFLTNLGVTFDDLGTSPNEDDENDNNNKYNINDSNHD